jgi:hypothetical protein
MSDNRKDTIEVFVNEEYGYRTWIWKPNMTEEEFIAWWGSLTETDIIKYYFNIRSVPGIITPTTVKEISTNNEDCSRIAGDPKTYQPYYYCHMHDVDDSFIVVNKTRYDFRRTTRRDWKVNWIDWVLKNQIEPVS